MLPLQGDGLLADGLWARACQHSIEDLAADGGFGLLGCESSCP